MTTSKIDKLIEQTKTAELLRLEAETELPPVPADMVQLTQTKLDGTKVAAYYFCGYMNWWPVDKEDPDLGPVPPEAAALYIRAV